MTVLKIIFTVDAGHVWHRKENTRQTNIHIDTFQYTEYNTYMHTFNIYNG